MKNNIRNPFGLLQLILVVAIVGFIAALALPALAQSQNGNGIGTVTNMPAIVNVATVSNTTSYIKLYKESGLALSFKTTSSAGNSNAIVYIKPSVDGTNAATTAWVWTQPASAGSTAVIGTTNWSAATLAQYDGLFISGITNGHATGILTNNGFVFRRFY